MTTKGELLETVVKSTKPHSGTATKVYLPVEWRRVAVINLTQTNHQTATRQMKKRGK